MTPPEIPEGNTDNTATRQPIKALVTGGGGFLGGAIARKLVERGDSVRTFQRGDYAWHEELGIESIRGDLAEGDNLDEAVSGCDIVFHVAAKAGVWGDYDSYCRPNIWGTRDALYACQRQGIEHFVFTSSPSVTFSGSDESGIEESHPYPKRYLAHYPATKAMAEKIVIDVNNGAGDYPDARLATVALRPHLIWGPGDPHLVPRILDRAKAGKLKLVGSGDNRVDSTYIDNAADAHIAAGDALLRDGRGAKCAGKAYFISNGEPIPMRELINRILEAGGQPAVTKRVSPKVAYAAGAVLETLYRLLRKKNEPIMTRFVARQLATEHWYDITAAKRDFGYEPRVSLDEGMAKLKASLNAST